MSFDMPKPQPFYAGRNFVGHTTDFFEFAFPTDLNRKVATDGQHVFSDYGSLEAVNIEFDKSKMEFAITAKKQKPLIGTSNYGFFVPVHPALPFGEPEALVKLLKLPNEDDLVTTRQPRKGDISDMQYLPRVEEQINNFLLDHPDAGQGTLLQMLSHYFPHWGKRYSRSKCIPDKRSRLECGNRMPHKFLPKNNLGALRCKYPLHFDPFMFDVPHSLLNELLVEELVSETKCLLYDSSCTGGALNYQHIRSNQNHTYGLLLHPTGQSMCELRLQLLCLDVREQTRDGVVEEFKPEFYLGSDHRSSLKGRILQINSQNSFDDDSLIFAATRTMHDVLMTSVDTSNCELVLTENDEYDKLHYTSDCVKHFGVFHTPAVVTSACVSPYINGECAVALDDGKLFLWDSIQSPTSRQSDTEISPVWERKLRKYDGGWRQVEFGSHPRQLYVAGRRSVKLLDLRGKSIKKKLYEISTIREDQDKVITISSGTNFTVRNEFQVFVATSTELHLCDIRHRKVPLLTFGLNMRTPCQHLAVIGSPVDDDKFNLNSVVMAASQKSQDIHMFQYNTRATQKNSALLLNNSTYAMQPPISTSPVYSCETFKDFRKSMQGHYIRCHGHLKNRLSYPIVGVTGFPYRTNLGKSGIIALQLSGCGDVMFQPFFLEKPEVAWGSEKTVTASKLPGLEKLKIEKADQIRLDWAQKACEKYRVNAEKQNPMNLRYTQTTLNCKQFSSRKFMQRLLEAHKTKPEGDCELCLQSLEDPTKSPSVEMIEDMTDALPVNRSATLCQGCGSDKDYVKSALRCHENGVFHPSRLENDDNGIDAFWNNWSLSVDTTGPPMQSSRTKPLKLVEPSFEKMSLGRVLWATWDAPYTELWDIVNSEFANDKVKRVARNYQERFDLAKTSAVHSSQFESKSTSSEAKVSNKTNVELSVVAREPAIKSFSPVDESNPQRSHENTTSPLLFEDPKSSQNIYELVDEARTFSVKELANQAPLTDVDPNIFLVNSTSKNKDEKPTNTTPVNLLNSQISNQSQNDVTVDDNKNATDDSPDTLEALLQMQYIVPKTTTIQETRTQTPEKLLRPTTDRLYNSQQDSSVLEVCRVPLFSITSPCLRKESVNSVKKSGMLRKKSLKRKMTGFF